MRKRVIGAGILLLVVVTIVFLVFNYEASTREKRKEENPLVIHVIMKSKASEPDFWRIVEQGVREAEKEFGVRCITKGPSNESKIQDQIKLVEESIAQAPDAIVLAATDEDALVPVCNQIKEAGIPLIMLDSDINCPNKETLVATDNYEIGRKLAGVVNDMIEDQQQVGVVAHVETTTTAVHRLQGFEDFLEDKENRLVEVVYCDGSAQKAKEQATEMLAKYPQLRCLVGLNETSGLGIAYALSEQEDREVVHISCDSSKEQIYQMEKGILKAFVIQHPFNMGYFSVEAAVKVLSGQSVPSFIDTESKLIFAEEMYLPDNEKLLFPFMDE